MGFSLGKIVSPIGSLLNGITGVTDTANESYKASKRLMNMENANNIALWNMQNEYNTPAAQIARMKDAGIDVNPMTYAVGNGSMSSTASSVSSSTPHMPNYSSAGNPISSLLSVLHSIKDLEYKQKQIDNYDHDHSSPYKDIADVIKSIFLGAPGSPTTQKVVENVSAKDYNPENKDKYIFNNHLFRVRRVK